MIWCGSGDGLFAHPPGEALLGSHRCGSLCPLVATGAKVMERLLLRPQFDGPVTPGNAHVLAAEEIDRRLRAQGFQLQARPAPLHQEPERAIITSWPCSTSWSSWARWVLAWWMFTGSIAAHPELSLGLVCPWPRSEPLVVASEPPWLSTPVSQRGIPLPVSTLPTIRFTRSAMESRRRW